MAHVTSSNAQSSSHNVFISTSYNVVSMYMYMLYRTQYQEYDAVSKVAGDWSEVTTNK